MCIEFENSKYMLDLDTPVTEETDISGNLIDANFLKPLPAADINSSGGAVVTGGSRKNREQKSKKTKSNYYTYKK